jgi:hypothetical protein
MKVQWNILRKLSGNNRGSGIVVVLVSMTCIALMSASLLFMSYTAMRMRATERQASRDFYNAETAMDELRAGAQSIASDALGRAYKAVLTTYSEGGQMTERFADAYVEELENSTLLNGNSYSLDVLKAYVTAPRSGVLNIYCPDDKPEDPNDHPIVDTSGNRITLKNIYVEYTLNGYTTTISSDISFGMPAFTYTPPGDMKTGLPEHALIADKALVHTMGNSTIDITGSAYVGSMNLSAANSQLSISSGTLVCANDAVISGYTADGRLVTAENVKFWANRIEVKGGGTLSLNGDTRVQDDLELAGGKSLVTLSGSYYGFGDGSVPAENANDGNINNDNPADYSSAILVNGLDSMLDISGLKNLMLAGRSYISDSLYSSHSGGANGVGMLESIAVRSNQQMYLLDPAEVEIDLDNDGDFERVDQNPFVLDPNSVVSSETLLDPGPGGYERLRLTEEAKERGDQYDYKLTARQYAFFNDQDVLYCYMEFTELNKANAYFEQLFAQNKHQLDSYLVADTFRDQNGNPLSSDLDPSVLGGSISTYGYGLTGDGSTTDPYDLSQPTRTQFYPAGLRSAFNQLKKTLIDGNTNVSKNTTPYTYIVNTDKVTALTDGEPKEFYDAAGKKVGVIVDGDYPLNGSDAQKDLCLVIASGDVKVTASAYTGLIISGGTITLEGFSTQGSNQSRSVITYDDDAVLLAFSASAEGNPSDTMATYLLHGVYDDNGADASGGTGAWDLDSLVTYKNWTKN